MEQSYKSDAGVERERDEQNRSLVTQNIELRRKLEEEHSNYKRKLQAYQDGQQRQAQLVQKLQAKVASSLYYKYVTMHHKMLVKLANMIWSYRPRFVLKICLEFKDARNSIS